MMARNTWSVLVFAAAALGAVTPARADTGPTAHAGVGLQRTTGNGSEAEAAGEALLLGAGYVFTDWFEVATDLHVGRTRLDAGAAVDETWGWRFLGVLRSSIRLGSDTGPIFVAGPALMVSDESLNARAGDATTRTSARTLAIGGGGGLRLPLTGRFSVGPELLYGHALLRRTCIRSGGFEHCGRGDTDRALFAATVALHLGF